MGFQCELDPCVWSKLPQELLESVFARLPTEKIGLVRALSKSWNAAGSSCSAFTKACAKLQPNLCGIMWLDSGTRSYHVRAYDTSSSKWLPVFGIHGLPECLFPATACDGGLVCLASMCQLQRALEFLPVIVANPLTGEWRQLPPPRLIRKCETVQLKVDRQTGTYKIFLSGAASVDGREVVAEAYHSSTNEWSRLESGLILGLEDLTQPPNVHDCSTGAVRSWYPPRPQGEILQYQTHMNDLYVLELLPLYEDWMYNADGHLIVYDDGCLTSRFAVSKYEDGNWRFGADGSGQVARPPVMYKCELVDIPGETVLFVSGTFLLVVRHSLEHDHLMMFYDMEKGKWHEYDWDVGIIISSEDWENAFGCELRWDARP